jgi:hypothetical protein
MKKLLILIASFPFVLNAQEAKKNRIDKAVSIGISFSPDYNFRTLKNNDGSSSSAMVIDRRNQIEKGKFGFTTGLSLHAGLSKKLELQTGLLYSSKGYKSPKQVLDYASRPGEPVYIKSEASFNYLDVPLKLNFISGSGQVRFIVGAGLTANFLLNDSEKVILIYADGSEHDFHQSIGFTYKKFNLSSLISAGVQFELRKNILLRTEPTFRYGLLKINDTPVTAYLWNVGFAIGVCYKLNLK